MSISRCIKGAIGPAGLIGAAVTATPASAQFYYKTTPFETGTIQGNEPGFGDQMPGATPAEYRAALLWNMRSALNVAALQCEFLPSLDTLENYNAMLYNHKAELKASFDTVAAYFKRTNKTPKAGQTAFDIFGTRTYSSYSTVGAQLSFCQVAADVGRDALFAPKGRLIDVAQHRMRELKSSLTMRRELQFYHYLLPYIPADLPNLDPRCWNKKNVYDFKRCPWPGFQRLAQR